MKRIFVYLWVSPATLLGLLSIPFAVVSGGRVRLEAGVIEVSGGFLRTLLETRVFQLGPVAAVTLGHVIIGQDDACLIASRKHERVHVAQYEQWGPMMAPLYFFSSAIAKVRGQHPYWDNHFEKQAYRVAEACSSFR